VTAEGIALVIGAVAALITALAGLVNSWQKKAALDADALEDERNALHRWVEVLLRHIHALRLLLAEHGIETPPMPDEDEFREGGKR
jgi:hypothetical protein